MESKKGEIIIYQTEDARIDVRLENENIWLTRQQLACYLDVITKPLANTLIMPLRKNWQV